MGMGVAKMVATAIRWVQFLAAFSFLVFITLEALCVDLMHRRRKGLTWGDMFRGVLSRLKETDYLVSVPQVIRDEGYDVEIHEVETKDGFLLGLHRVMARTVKDGLAPRSRGSVILQHGLFQTSMPYVLNGRNRALAFILADEGFDVWLGNNRGNLYSRKHVSMDSSSDKFWDWCVDDLALDVEANVDYVRSYTKEQKIYFIGHSQGGAQGLMAFSANVELAGKIRLFVAMAPGAFVKEFGNKWLDRLADMYDRNPNHFFALFGRGCFMPQLELVREIVGMKIFSYMAYAMFNYLFHWSHEQWDLSREPLYFKDTPGGTSARTLAQWMQHSRSRRFARYDHGSDLNQAKYMQQDAPDYPLHQIECPTAVVYGGKDRLLDFQRLISNVNKDRLVWVKEIPQHEHMDSLNGVCCSKILYPELINVLSKH